MVMDWENIAQERKTMTCVKSVRKISKPDLARNARKRIFSPREVSKMTLMPGWRRDEEMEGERNFDDVEGDKPEMSLNNLRLSSYDLLPWLLVGVEAEAMLQAE